jgi:hypothetical protein
MMKGDDDLWQEAGSGCFLGCSFPNTRQLPWITQKTAQGTGGITRAKCYMAPEFNLDGYSGKH